MRLVSGCCAVRVVTSTRGARGNPFNEYALWFRVAAEEEEAGALLQQVCCHNRTQPWQKGCKEAVFLPALWCTVPH